MISTLITVGGVAEMLVCSQRTVHRLVRDREYRLPAIRIRGRLLFDESDVKRWLEGMKKRSVNLFQPDVKL